MRRRARLTIPRRVFLAFALMLTVSGSVSVASFLEHRQTASTLSLVHEGYLPLAVSVSEARATQSVFGNVLDRMLTERSTLPTRTWLAAARRLRPAGIARALDGIAAIEHMAPPAADRASLARARRELKRVASMVQEGEPRYGDLFSALDAGDKDAVDRVLADLQARERAIDGRLRAVWNVVLRNIEATSERASAEQQEALEILIALLALALVVGVAVTVWSQRVLSPLPQLQERVAAVARGDLARRIAPNTDDEIGQLGREFERMVAALAARDESLQRLQEMQLQSERLAAVGRMAAHVTHEVRNPLSSIGLNVEMLEEELASAGPEAKDLLRAIHREIERLTSITEEYLELARLPHPSLAAEDLGALVRESADFVRPELAAHGVTLQVKVDDGVPQVQLDEAQIRQVLLNLLKNAREAMPSGGAVVLHVARGEHDERGVTLRVTDQGTGMTEEQRTRIFDPFYTTKARGTGLGLPLSQQIVVAHGGLIRCESEPGRGTVFEIWLPSERIERPATEAQPSVAEVAE